MRSMSVTMKRKVASRIQAGENGMSASLWVGRPTTPLTDDNFLEKQTVLYSDSITKTSLAVCHPRLSRGATNIYFAYIESGEIKITKTYYVDIMERHEWEPVEFSEWAEDVSICFDGTMPKAPSGWVEFKTEEVPWVFWCLNGVLYGKRMDDPGEPVVLAEANCSAVSAVRAMWSSYGGFDFGLVVFFLLNGQLYYRQLIAGEWMDAEVVPFGPDGVKWEDLAAFRTWDYRVGVQCKSTTGTYYEMFTQFMGIGKQNAEHLEVRNVKADGLMTGITYNNTSEIEHVELSNVFAGAPYGGLYSLDMPVITSAYNVEDANGDWGTTVVVTFSNYLVADQVASNYLQFALVDSWGAAYYPNTAVLGSDGKTVTLTFEDFNAASGLCEIQYAPGTVYSMATILVEATSISFTPQNLNPPAVPQPEVVSIRNLNSEGTEIAVEFTEALTGSISDNESKFTITTKEYNMVPGGILSEKTRSPLSLSPYASYLRSPDLGSASLDKLSHSKGTLKLEVVDLE